MAAKEYLVVMICWYIPVYWLLVHLNLHHIFPHKMTCKYKFRFHYVCMHFKSICTSGKAGKPFSQLSYHYLLTSEPLPANFTAQRIHWLSNYSGQRGLHWILGCVEQDKMALMVAFCTDTWCSNLTLFSGQKILSHLANQCAKNNDLIGEVTQGRHKS